MLPAALPRLHALRGALFALALAAALPAPAAPARPPQRSAARPPARPAPAMRLGSDVEPLAYRLHLVVDPDQPRHRGEVEIDLRLHQPLPADGTIRLHAKALNIRAVWLEVGAQRWVGRVQALDAERVALRFGRPLPAGRARLGLAFHGAIDDKEVYGLFRQRAGGRWMAFTQFEATGARLAFPLFDEPGWKVPWTLSLTVPETLGAVANMPVERETAEGGGFKRVDFAATPPLPSYLLAFAVGDFERLDAAAPGADAPWTAGFITPRGRSAEAGFAAGVTGGIVQQLEAYFGLPYPFAKLDSLAIPATVGFTAMENAGLVTYASSVMLARPGEQTPAFQREYVSTAAHELAHQWFGNLVTPAWWDDLWLNESFASWMGDRITAEVMPAWGWQTSLQRARAEAMAVDRLASARRIEQPVKRDEDMGNLWDAIVYQKGQTVLAMFEAWLGPDRFQAGVRRYLQRHAWGNASGDDFFKALAVEDPALPAALRSFTRQGGIPLVDLTLLCEGGPPRLRLAQSRLQPLGAAPAADGGGPPQRWQIPLLLRTPAGNSRLLLTDAEATLDLPDADCPAWVLANAGGAGYYRVAYAGDGLSALGAAPGLSIGERLVLLDDARGLHDAGRLGNVGLLALIQANAGQPERELVEAAMDLLTHLRPLAAAAQQPAHAQRWQALFGERARSLGWLPRATDSDDDRMLRVKLLPALADQGEDAALRAQALQLAQAWLADRSALGAALRGPVLASAALADDGAAAGPDGAVGRDDTAHALFDNLLAALRASDNRNERTDLLNALGRFRQPALAQRARALLLDPGVDIRDSQRQLLDAQAELPALRAEALAFVARHHGELSRRLGRDEPAWLPTHFATGCSDDEARRIAAAFGRHAARFQGGQLALQRTLEAVALCSAWHARQAGGL